MNKYAIKQSIKQRLASKKRAAKLELNYSSDYIDDLEKAIAYLQNINNRYDQFRTDFADWDDATSNRYRVASAFNNLAIAIDDVLNKYDNFAKVYGQAFLHKSMREHRDT